MTRKHVEAVITDCEDCTDSFWENDKLICAETGKDVEAAWYDGGDYICTFCPLADAPCETCNNLRTVPDGSGHKICPTCCAIDTTAITEPFTEDDEVDRSVDAADMYLLNPEEDDD